jgi:hypothetical protein
VSQPDPGSPEPDGEIVDGLPVVADAYELDAPRPVLVPGRQAAALAATGFVAGACTVAVVQHRRMRLGARRRRKRKSAGLGDIVSSNSFLVDVHLLRRD